METVTIDRLSHRGDGIALVDGVEVHVAAALPGEIVEIERSGKNAVLTKIVTPSSARTEPPCPHFGACGGCTLQHVSDDFLTDWKVAVVTKALLAHGIETDFRPIATSPTHSRRRAGFSGRRTRKTEIVGFHARRSDDVIDIRQCDLVQPDLVNARPALAALIRAGASRSAQIKLSVTSFPNGLDVSVRDGKPLDGPLQATLGRLTQEHDLIRLSWNGEIIAMSRPPVLRFGNSDVTPPPDTFLQATKHGEDALVSAVRDAVHGASEAADLFAGCGTFALALAPEMAVHAVEGEASMLKALDAGWRRSKDVRRASTERRDLFSRPLLAAELAKFDAVVIDPPRVGAEAQCMEIAASEVPVVAAVSCNPVSFARDAALLLAEGLNLDWVQVVDQFRWSPHVEMVARFSR